MSIITFWNGTKEQCGNTASALALATYMAIERNIKKFKRLFSRR